MNALSRFINRLNFSLLWVMAFLVSIAVYGLAVYPQWRKVFIEKFGLSLIDFDLFFQCGAAIVMIYLLLILSRELKHQRQNRNSYKFPACNGDASIDKKTISRVIKSIITKYSSVKFVKINTLICGSKIDISIKLKVSDELALKTLIDNIQYSIRSIFSDLFAQDIISGLHIKILDVISSDKGQFSVYSSVVPRLDPNNKSIDTKE